MVFNDYDIYYLYKYEYTLKFILIIIFLFQIPMLNEIEIVHDFIYFIFYSKFI